MSELERARDAYREESANGLDNEREARTARAYIAQLESKVAQLESHLRARQKGRW